MQSLVRTGIFGGSFNPIHIGHLALANYLCEFEGLDELWFMITPHNPLKKQTELMPDSFRLELARLAVKGYDKFKASDFEFGLSQPSYTIHTLDALKKAYPKREFHLIIGADNWQLFHRWKESKRMLRENKILVYPRSGSTVNTDSLPANVKLVNAPLIEVSSTFIRDAIAEGKDVRYFLPSVEVWNKLHSYFMEHIK